MDIDNFIVLSLLGESRTVWYDKWEYVAINNKEVNAKADAGADINVMSLSLCKTIK